MGSWDGHLNLINFSGEELEVYIPINVKAFADDNTVPYNMNYVLDSKIHLNFEINNLMGR